MLTCIISNLQEQKEMHVVGNFAENKNCNRVGRSNVYNSIPSMNVNIIDKLINIMDYLNDTMLLRLPLMLLLIPPESSPCYVSTSYAYFPPFCFLLMGSVRSSKERNQIQIK